MDFNEACVDSQRRATAFNAERQLEEERLKNLLSSLPDTTASSDEETSNDSSES